MTPPVSHTHRWTPFAVLTQTPSRRGFPAALSDDEMPDPVVQAKIMSRCDVCGEIRDELYEGPPSGLPEIPFPSDRIPT